MHEEELAQCKAMLAISREENEANRNEIMMLKSQLNQASGIFDDEW